MSLLRAPRLDRRARIVALLCVLLLVAAGAVPVGGGVRAALPAGSEHRELTRDGAWCWFGGPRAVTHEGQHRRTYVGWVSSGGSIVVASYDHETSDAQTFAIRATFQQNDHASPSLLVRPDGRIVIFYSCHRGSRINYRVSTAPEDVSSWGEEKIVGARLDGHGGYTYPSPALSEDEGGVFLFFRGAGYQPSLLISSDGETWDAGREVLRGAGERPYAKYDAAGSAIHMAFTDGHPRREPGNGIHYACYDGGEFRRADGSKIAGMDGLPFDADSADTVYNGAESGAPAWVWDVAADHLGRPVIVFAVFPAGGEHRYRYARWSGTAWENHEIVAAGSCFPTVSEGEKRFEPHYSGGLALDHEDPSVVYLSRPVHGVFEIERWVTEDGGMTWRWEAVTRGSSVNNVRPCVPRDRLTDGPRVLWMRGNYTDYANYSTAIVADVVAARGEVRGESGEPGAFRPPEATDTEDVMRRVLRWQLAQFEARGEAPDPGWKQAVFMTGVMGAYEATGDEEYRDAALAWVTSTGWLPGPRARHADDHCAGQVYIELRAGGDDDRAIDAIRRTLDAMVAEPRSGRVEWSWCDALFMAPPAMARLSRMTGDPAYADLMDVMWWDAHDHLYDPAEHLFYRDERSMRRRDGSVPRSWHGNKILWSRGNGWVLAGTARVLGALPDDFSSRPDYVRLFSDMAKRVASLQGEDGLWRPSLLDPHEQQPPESSGSALFCYALAWGVREGLLDRVTYVPVIEKAWDGLVSAVDDDGKLGWVQSVGRGPAFASRDQSAPYGVGAFLLAGSEVLRLERAAATASPDESGLGRSGEAEKPSERRPVVHPVVEPPDRRSQP